jgi:threonine dehydratase
MAEAWRRGPGGEPGTAGVDTIADGIAVGAPIAASLADMRGTVDDIVEVDDAALLEAMRLLHAHAGLVTEPAGVAGLAALLGGGRDLGGHVATVICGGNLTGEQLAAYQVAGAR